MATLLTIVSFFALYYSFILYKSAAFESTGITDYPRLEEEEGRNVPNLGEEFTHHRRLYSALDAVGADGKTEYLYSLQHPEGSEHLRFKKRMLFFSIFVGNLQKCYPHFKFLLESMRRNEAVVDFVIIHLLSDNSDIIVSRTTTMLDKAKVKNLTVKFLHLEEFQKVVKDRLGIDVPFKSWSRCEHHKRSGSKQHCLEQKLCDYKPVLAYLFPEYSGNEEKYEWWGYGDLDLIWGNFSRYAYMFQDPVKEPIVRSEWWHVAGPAQFFYNQNWTRGIFFNSPLFVSLLQNESYHSLDEHGGYHNPVDGGKHSISNIVNNIVSNNKSLTLKSGKMPEDSVFYANKPLLWKDGAIVSLGSSKYFPPGRELLFWHKPHFAPPQQSLLCSSAEVNITSTELLLHRLFKSGFLLPDIQPPDGWCKPQ